MHHVPGASSIERWRNEQAALKVAAQAQTAENASVAAKSTPEPVQAAVMQPPRPSPATVQASAPQLQAQAASAQPAVAAEPDQVAEAERKAERAKAAKAAKKARLARERAGPQQAARAAGPVLRWRAATLEPAGCLLLRTARAAVPEPELRLRATAELRAVRVVRK